MPSWLGWPEIVVLVVLALVIFGPKRLPELGSSLGKAITGFRRGLSDTEKEFKKGLAETKAAEVEPVEEAGASSGPASHGE